MNDAYSDNDRVRKERGPVTLRQEIRDLKQQVAELKKINGHLTKALEMAVVKHTPQICGIGPNEQLQMEAALLLTTQTETIRVSRAEFERILDMIEEGQKRVERTKEADSTKG